MYDFTIRNEVFYSFLKVSFRNFFKIHNFCNMCMDTVNASMDSFNVAIVAKILLYNAMSCKNVIMVVGIDKYWW